MPTEQDLVKEVEIRELKAKLAAADAAVAEAVLEAYRLREMLGEVCHLIDTNAPAIASQLPLALVKERLEGKSAAAGAALFYHFKRALELIASRNPGQCNACCTELTSAAARALAPGKAP